VVGTKRRKSFINCDILANPSANSAGGQQQPQVAVAAGDGPQEWNNNGQQQPPPATEESEHYSFEDSDRFEEDSLCSWSSEPESVCNNWRGWKKPNNQINSFGFGGSSKKAAEGKS
jgi:hypothetical protein